MVVLSCGDLGDAVAQALRSVPGVASVALVTAPYARKPTSLLGKIRAVRRTQGLGGLFGVLVAKLRTWRAPRPPAAPSPAAARGLDHYHFPDLHAPECVALLRRLAPDLGVVAGTYILREPIFSIPRLGSINLHSGKAPEYRGAAPGFWELYNGEGEVGITIHRVAAALDAGDILLQEMFPFDPAPPDDPLEYLDHYRRDVLRPNGISLVARAVALIAAGTARFTPQDPLQARTYRTPEYRAIRELRRRVKARRRAGVGLGGGAADM